MTVRCLAKKQKVGVKNKENKTACFIEIEGLLNSPELISDLPGLEIEERPQGQGSRAKMGGGVGEEDSGQEPPELGGLARANVTLFRAWWAASPAHRSRLSGEVILTPQPPSLRSPASGLCLPPPVPPWGSAPVLSPPRQQPGLDRSHMGTWHSTGGQQLPAPDFFLFHKGSPRPQL